MQAQAQDTDFHPQGQANILVDEIIYYGDLSKPPLQLITYLECCLMFWERYVFIHMHSHHK